MFCGDVLGRCSISNLMASNDNKDCWICQIGLLLDPDTAMQTSPLTQHWRLESIDQEVDTSTGAFLVVIHDLLDARPA